MIQPHTASSGRSYVKQETMDSHNHVSYTHLPFLEIRSFAFANITSGICTSSAMAQLRDPCLQIQARLLFLPARVKDVSSITSTFTSSHAESVCLWSSVVALAVVRRSMDDHLKPQQVHPGLKAGSRAVSRRSQGLPSAGLKTLPRMCMRKCHLHCLTLVRCDLHVTRGPLSC
jgi:hypothetical protein